MTQIVGYCVISVIVGFVWFRVMFIGREYQHDPLEAGLSTVMASILWPITIFFSVVVLGMKTVEVMAKYATGRCD